MFGNTLTQEYVRGASLVLSFRVLTVSLSEITRGCCFIFLFFFFGGLELKFVPK